jgi:8-oxo-dGTP pyrophosphatase MutT (NUDIX family)
VFEKTTVARAASASSSAAASASSSSSSSSSPGFLVDFDASGRLSADERTRVAAPVMAALRDAGVVTGWRDELFPVTRAYGEDALFLVERACASLLGIRAFGVHVNGFVTLPDGELELWVARRSRSKPTFPRKLDHLVAGGLPAGVAPGECVAKECAEEAGVSREWATRAVPVGTVSYNQNYEGCPKRDVLFCYDLELPPEFVPVAVDGEVESFERVPVREAMRMVAETRDFKANCCLVIVDFFVRRGLVTPEEPGYAELVRSLRQ